MSNQEGMPTKAGALATEYDIDISKAWYDQAVEKPVDQVTALEFEQLCEALYGERAKYDVLKEQAKDQNSRVEKLEAQILSYLKAMGRDSYKSKLGTISKIAKRSWALPKSDEDRRAFFNALRLDGVFDGMISVNSNTMNAFMKEKFELAEAEGRSAAFAYPGIGEPSVFDSIRVVKGK